MKTALLFPGQGSQYIGMAKEFYDNYSASKEVFDKANEVLNINLKKLCFEGPIDELSKTEITQPAILTASYAIYKALEKEGINADITAGLSLGEYTALTSSGAMRFEDAVWVVKNRGKYMQETVPLGAGKMAAIIGLDSDGLDKLIDRVNDLGIIEGANYNCPNQIVISGESKAIERAVEVSKDFGAKKSVILPVSAPFHSSLLKPAGDLLCKDLQKVELNSMKYKIISNVTADYIKNTEEIKDLLIKQVYNPVYWQQSIEKMIDDGVENFIEVGPGKSLTTFTKKIARKKKVKINAKKVENLKDLNSLID